MTLVVLEAHAPTDVAAPVVSGDGDIVVSDVWITPTPLQELRRELPTILGRVRDLRRHLPVLRGAVDWLALGVQDARDAAGTWWRRYRHESRHAVQSHWFGRERSTAESVSYRHRTYQLRRAAERVLTQAPPDPEGELPGRPTESMYWVGWLERVVEVLRGEDEVLHPSVRHRFICS